MQYKLGPLTLNSVTVELNTQIEAQEPSLTCMVLTVGLNKDLSKTKVPPQVEQQVVFQKKLVLMEDALDSRWS